MRGAVNSKGPPKNEFNTNFCKCVKFLLHIDIRVTRNTMNLQIFIAIKVSDEGVDILGHV